MSNQQHTPEPWRLGRFSGPASYEKVRETCGAMDVVADTDTGPYVLAGCNINFPDDAKANARRIVACVNACAGIPTEQLESGEARSVRDDLADIATLEKQRDDLLAALEGLHKVCEIALSGKDGKQHTYFETRGGHFVEATKAMQEAEAAIASVKGGAQ